MSDATPRFGPGQLRMGRTTGFRLIASLALALVLWGWVTIQQDPPTTISPTVALRSPELEPPLQIVDDLADVTVRVALEGPRSVVLAVQPEAMAPHLELGEVDGPGNYTVPIAVTAPDAVDIRSIEPSRLSIVVDETIAASFRIDAQPVAPDDGLRRIGDVEPNPSSVTVTGPKRYVEQVARVVLEVDIGERATTFTDLFLAEAVDELGQPITGVEVRPQRIEATVPIEARGRAVPVLVQTAGNPATGYEAVDREAIPPMVLLDGPDAAIDQIVSVSTAPVRIEGATAPVRQAVTLTGLPADVTVVGPIGGNIDALVQIVPRTTTQTLTEQAVEVTDLAPGLTAEVEPGRVRVDVYAAQELLAGLRAGDVVPRVSAAGLGPGTHRVPLDVAVPAGVQWLGTEPADVTLSIRAALGTPVASPIASEPPG